MLDAGLCVSLDFLTCCSGGRGGGGLGDLFLGGSTGRDSSRLDCSSTCLLGSLGGVISLLMFRDEGLSKWLSPKFGAGIGLAFGKSGREGGDSRCGGLSGSLGGVLKGEILSSSRSEIATGAAKVSLPFLACGDWKGLGFIERLIGGGIGELTGVLICPMASNFFGSGLAST